MLTDTTALILSSATTAEMEALYLPGVEPTEPPPAADFEWIDTVLDNAEPTPEEWDRHQREYAAIQVWYARRIGKPIDPIDALVGKGLASYLPTPDSRAASLSDAEDQYIDAAVASTLASFDAAVKRPNARGVTKAREVARTAAYRVALAEILDARPRFDALPALCGGSDQHDPAEYYAAFPEPSPAELAMREEIMFADHLAELAYESSRRADELAYLDEFSIHGCARV